MKKLAFIILLALLIIVGYWGFMNWAGQFKIQRQHDSFVLDESVKGISKIDMLPKIEGSWFNLKYIDLLKRTKSPVTSASELKGYPCLYINKQSNNEYWWRTVDFHQMLGGKIIDFQYVSKNDYYTIVSDVDKPKWYIRIGENKLICRTALNKTTFEYIKTGKNNIYELINELVLNGEYQDNQEKKYVFNNGKAKWPNETFMYIINFAPSFEQMYDFFTVLDSKGLIKTQYSFDIKDNVLYLYKTFESKTSPALDRDKEPFLKLKKI